jgi:tRNA(Ile)-lysidine synthase
MVLSVSGAEFAERLNPLGPFGAPLTDAVGVSGGSDSMALAVLAADWARTAGGSVLALIVDHGLRPDSAAEAAEAAGTLARLGIPARRLTLDRLAPGASLPARARAARLTALEAACREAGIIDLLLGHHAADQAETVIMRQLRGSGGAGLAGMAAISETASLRLVRPLLGVTPARLKAVLTERGLGWAEDPTNADSRFTRARLRATRLDAAGAGAATRALTAAASADAQARRAAELDLADWLASAVIFRPEGFALLPDCPWPASALAAVLRVIAGAVYPASPSVTAAIAASPRSAIGKGICLGGARLLPAGRLGPGVLICREAAAMAGPVPARTGAAWDGRFRRPAPAPELPGETIGALGADGQQFRDLSELPAVVLGTLPAYRRSGGDIVAIPALTWPDPRTVSARTLLFHPPRPVCGAAFRGSVAQLGQRCHAGMGSPA